MTTRDEAAWESFRAQFKRYAEPYYFSTQRADRLAHIAARRVFGPETRVEKACAIEHFVVAVLAQRRLTAGEVYDRCSEWPHFNLTYGEFKKLLRTLVSKKHIAVPPPSDSPEDDLLLTASSTGGQEAYLLGGEGIPKGCLLAESQYDAQRPV